MREDYPVEIGLDPADWDDFRQTAHQALDMMVDYLAEVRTRPVWQRVPDDAAAQLKMPAPETGAGLGSAVDEFRRYVLPYPTGNIHPRFWSWVCGTGSPSGMVADMLASGMNSLTPGFDDSAATRVELQVLEWFKSMFGFPLDSSGLLVSGGSAANLVGLAVARSAKADQDIRQFGVGAEGARRQIVYGSTETHFSVQRAVELLGLGATHFRPIPVTGSCEIDVGALERAVRRDAVAGFRPAIVVANAGTVNTGAIDALGDVADLAAQHDMWLHVDGAFGAIAALIASPHHNLAGLARADSLAFDLHKWLHQQYSVGGILVRHAKMHEDTFRTNAAYLKPAAGGVAGGPVNFNDLGLQLSRSFMALRPWLTFKTHGLDQFRRLVAQNIDQARYLETLVNGSDQLELLAPTALNIVNFRFNPGELAQADLDTLNSRLVVELQERGVAAPSSTRIGGAEGPISIRVCITNHRSRREDFDALIDATLRIGRELCVQGAIVGRTA